MRATRSLALAGLGLLALLLVMFALWAGPPATAQVGPTATPTPARTFPQTGHTVGGRFLEYWTQHGGLAQQGYPLSEEISEVSDLNGQAYTVQYFERAVFEQHPEYGPPNDVLLSLLGVFEYSRRYGSAGAPGQHAATANPRFFSETGHTLGGPFRAYWETHGGLAQQGYPISDEFTEINALDGRPYLVQYFQRAVFELHPENAGTPYEVLLSQLGTFRYRAHFGSLAIPTPGAGRAQFAPHGSTAYLIWNEAPLPGQPGPAGPELRGLNLATGRPLAVAMGPGSHARPAIAGALAVWEDSAPGCDPCAAGILGRNLATGAAFSVAARPGAQRAPAIAGNRVAWVESRDSVSRLLLQDLGTGAVTVIATDTRATRLGPPALSNEYLVWSEFNPNTPAGLPAGTLHAYNLATAASSLIAPVVSWTGSYAVDGHHVVWDDGGVQFADLQTGETAVLAASGREPAIAGDTVVWSQPVGGGETDLWGLKLTNRRSLALVTDPGSQDSATLAGDWLVWENLGGPRDQQLGSVALARAFQVAQARPTATAVPPASPTTSYYPTPPPTAPVSATPGPDIRLYVANVVGVPAAAGHYVFYLAGPAPGVTPTPLSGALTALYGVDLSRRETFLVKNSPEVKTHLASDGETLVWIEQSGAGADQVRGFNLTTRSEFVVLTAGPAGGYRSLALDREVLYYQDVTPGHSGLYAHSLAGGADVLVAAAGENPVAADGALLWSESGYGGSPPRPQFTLHLRPAGTLEERVIATGATPFAGYGLSGDYAVWAFGDGAAADRRASVYSISAAHTDIVSPGPAFDVAIGGQTVAWTESGATAPGGTPLYSIVSSTLDTHRMTVPVRDVLGTLHVWAVLDGAVLFTVGSYGSPRPGDLYLLGPAP